MNPPRRRDSRRPGGSAVRGKSAAPPVGERVSAPPPLPAVAAAGTLGMWTDLYQLTMAAAYHVNHMNDAATFELFVRHLPPRRGFLLVAGLEEALDYLEAARFSPDDLEYLRGLPQLQGVPEDFFSYLARFRFTGDVRVGFDVTVSTLA